MNEEEKIYKVEQSLPNDFQRCLCFGYATYCCKEDMDEIPDWHQVIFKFYISSYKLKNSIPIDPEESILEEYSMREAWEMDEDEPKRHVIGVTLWKNNG